MKITEENIKKIAHLARLEFDESSVEELKKQMTEIITWVEKLQDLDTSGVEPITNMSTEINNLREDVVHQDLDHERFMKNAPKKDDDYFRVPKVIE